jgi:hypothetical protein
MKTHITTILCKSLLLLTLTLPLTANAVIIEITGTGTSADGLWDIQVTEGATFTSIETLLTSQPWWGMDGVIA